MKNIQNTDWLIVEHEMPHEVMQGDLVPVPKLHDIKVAGTSNYYPSCLEFFDKCTKHESYVALRPEPNNAFDKNAVAAVGRFVRSSRDFPLGFLPTEIANYIAQHQSDKWPLFGRIYRTGILKNGNAVFISICIFSNR